MFARDINGTPGSVEGGWEKGGGGQCVIRTPQGAARTTRMLFTTAVCVTESVVTDTKQQQTTNFSRSRTQRGERRQVYFVCCFCFYFTTLPVTVSVVRDTVGQETASAFLCVIFASSFFLLHDGYISVVRDTAGKRRRLLRGVCVNERVDTGGQNTASCCDCFFTTTVPAQHPPDARPRLCWARAGVYLYHRIDAYPYHCNVACLYHRRRLCVCVCVCMCVCVCVCVCV